MKKLNLEQMEMIEGGVNWGACASGGWGLLRLGLAVAAVPATGGLAIGAVALFVGTSITTGYALGNCFT